eukprot:13257403-Alexandrium_andersonii.AAC.1
MHLAPLERNAPVQLPQCTRSQRSACTRRPTLLCRWSWRRPSLRSPAPRRWPRSPRALPTS